jgi:hypothetical protein
MVLVLDLEYAEMISGCVLYNLGEKVRARGRADLKWFEAMQKRPMLPGLLGAGAHRLG